MIILNLIIILKITSQLGEYKKKKKKKLENST
jgi:hypothetical protein